MHYRLKESLEVINPGSFSLFPLKERSIYLIILLTSLLLTACGGSSKPAIVQYDTSSNIKPQFISTASKVAYTNRVYHYLAQAQDHNNGDQLVYSLFSAPTGMKINPDNGRITWVPSVAQLGSQFVIVKAMDNGSPPRADYQSFGINVQLSADNPDTLNAQDDFIGTAINQAVNIPVLSNDYNHQASTKLSIISQTAHGRLQVLSDQTVLYTPDNDYRGDDQFIYEVTDGTVTDTATVTIAVGCADCNREKVINLRWDPSVSGINAGYLIYYGESENKIDRLATNLSIRTGLDENAPSVRLSAQQDLGLTKSNRVCFQISAYVSSIESELSAPICAIL